MTSSLGRGVQPRRSLALAFDALRTTPSRGARLRMPGDIALISRTTKSGRLRFGAAAAPAAPRRVRTTLATSNIDIVSPATAMKRSPLAFGSTMASR